MKKIKSLLILLLIAVFGYAANINVTNPGTGNDIYANLVTAVASASNGDVLIIPTGDFYVNGRVTITKFLSLKGTDTTNTILRRNDATSDATVLGWESIFRYAIFSNKRSNIVIQGITFKSKTVGTVKDIGIDMCNAVDWVIHSCKFMYFGEAAISIRHTNTFARSLIYNCNFVHNQKGNGLGYGYSINVNGQGRPDVWLSNPPYGSWNSNYVEDCKFSEARHAIAGSGGALYVFRYNLVRDTWINNPSESYTHWGDTHSARGTADANYYSSRMVEIYNNTAINTVFDDGTSITAGQNASRLVELGIALRGGEGVVYNNYISGFQYGIGIYADATPWGSTYPLPYCPGYTSGLRKGSANTGNSRIEGSGDFYVWSNTFVSGATLGLTGTTAAFLNYNYPSGAFVQDRDYHLSAKPNYIAAPYPHYLRR